MVASVRVVLAVILLTALAGCAGSGKPRPVWASAPDADVATLSTFHLAGPEEGQRLTVLDTQVHTAIRAQLLAKGYVESPDAPDFVVAYRPVAYEARSGSSPLTIGIGMGTWGRNVGGSVGTSIPVGGQDDERVTHRLAVRAIDPGSERELWIGTTTSIEPPAATDVVERAVAGVMQGFPARRN
jgi:hypothetical protein